MAYALVGWVSVGLTICILYLYRSFVSAKQREKIDKCAMRTGHLVRNHDVSLYQLDDEFGTPSKDSVQDVYHRCDCGENVETGVRPLDCAICKTFSRYPWVIQLEIKPSSAFPSQRRKFPQHQHGYFSTKELALKKLVALSNLPENTGRRFIVARLDLEEEVWQSAKFDETQ